MRAIDADALQLAIVEEGQANKRKKYIIGDIWELTGAEIREVINSLPTIQPEIIRCKDCKYWNKGSCECREHAVNCQDYMVGDIETEAEHFCGYAERREDG